MAKAHCDDPTRLEMIEYLNQQGCNSFEAEQAIYWFAHDWHGGQGSNLYSALSCSRYRPGPCEAGVSGSLAEIAYELLEERYVTITDLSNQL